MAVGTYSNNPKAGKGYKSPTQIKKMSGGGVISPPQMKGSTSTSSKLKKSSNPSSIKNKTIRADAKQIGKDKGNATKQAADRKKLVGAQEKVDRSRGSLGAKTQARAKSLRAMKKSGATLTTQQQASLKRINQRAMALPANKGKLPTPKPKNPQSNGTGITTRGPNAGPNSGSFAQRRAALAPSPTK